MNQPGRRYYGGTALHPPAEAVFAEALADHASQMREIRELCFKAAEGSLSEHDTIVAIHDIAQRP